MRSRLTEAHVWALRRFRGRIAGRIAGQPVLLLQTRGRRTRLLRRTPIQFARCDGALVVVASGGGTPRPPAWWLNLQATPQAVAEIRGVSIPVTAREAEGEERERLWRTLAATNPWLERTQAKLARRLALVVLEPAPGYELPD